MEIVSFIPTPLYPREMTPGTHSIGGSTLCKSKVVTLHKHTAMNAYKKVGDKESCIRLRLAVTSTSGCFTCPPSVPSDQEAG